MYLIWPRHGPEPIGYDELIELYEPEPGKPLLRVNFVTSVDGAVEIDGYSAGLGSPADKQVFGLLRMYADALMVGAGTLRRERYHAVKLDQARRQWRDWRGLDPYPRLVVVSARLDLDPASPALAEAPVRPIILTHAGSPPQRRAALSAVADVQIHGDTEVDLAAAIAALHEQGMAHVLCEGGPHLLGALTAADQVNELCLTVAPLLTGAGAGRITAGPASALRGLALAHVLVDDDVLLLRYVRDAESARARQSTDGVAG
jgi:riboflavin biosynthesis pyrimidine reductase